MARSKNAGLGDSWVVNGVSVGAGGVGGVGPSEIEDDDISWKDQSGRSSSSERSAPDQRTPRLRRRRGVLPGRDTGLATGPGLVFPTMHSPPPKARTAKAAAPTTRASPLGQRTAAAASYRSAAARQPPPQSEYAYEYGGISSGSGMLLSALDYVLSIVKSILSLLRQPIAILLAVYLFVGILALTYNLLTSSITTALSPLCGLPLSSVFPLCSSYRYLGTHQPASLSDGSTVSGGGGGGGGGHADPEFDTLMSTHDQLSDILSSTSAAVSLPLDMKRSETSIRDLRQIVRFSSLPARNELVFEFDGFIDTARTASYDLQKFNSHVGRSVDIVLATARWTERVLDDMALQEQHHSSSFWSSSSSYLGLLLLPFRSLTGATGNSDMTQHRILETYISHTRIISDQLSALITEASALLLTLQSLEDRLDLMHAIALQSQHDTHISRADTLSQLWTMLGGNRAHLARYEAQLQLLGQVAEYRRLAWAHVSATLVKLQAMQAELEELRERVGSAEAEVAVVPRAKDRTPLAVHLQAIRLGVERLEGERESARSVQRSEVARVVSAGGNDPDRLDAASSE